MRSHPTTNPNILKAALNGFKHSLIVGLLRYLGNILNMHNVAASVCNEDSARKDSKIRQLYAELLAK